MLPLISNPAIEGKIPPDIYQSLDSKLRALEASLLKLDPELPKHLRESHALLITYPESVHLLQDEEIANLVRAAEQWTKTSIVNDANKGTTGRGKKKIDVANDF